MQREWVDLPFAMRLLGVDFKELIALVENGTLRKLGEFGAKKKVLISYADCVAHVGGKK